MKITKMVGGKEVEVPIDEIWDSLCKIIRLSKILATCIQEDQKKYTECRLSFLVERLDDIRDLTFIKNNGLSA